MKENELRREIGRIVREAEGLNIALTRIQELIARQCGGALLILRPASARGAAPAVQEFLESRQFPFRGLYIAPLDSGHPGAGTLVACIGAWAVPADLLRRIVHFAGQELAGLAVRLALPVVEYMEAA